MNNTPSFKLINVPCNDAALLTLCWEQKPWRATNTSYNEVTRNSPVYIAVHRKNLHQDTRTHTNRQGTLSGKGGCRWSVLSELNSRATLKMRKGALSLWGCRGAKPWKKSRAIPSVCSCLLGVWRAYLVGGKGLQWMFDVQPLLVTHQSKPLGQLHILGVQGHIKCSLTLGEKTLKTTTMVTFHLGLSGNSPTQNT